MKFIFLLLLFLSYLHARLPENGESVFVELKSGIRQKAEFAGFSADTVLLGGYIKNKYTVVRLPKTSFLHIISAQSGDTLSLENQNDSLFLTHTDSALKVSDSIPALNDSTLTTTDSTSFFKDKIVIVPLNRRPIDSVLTENIQSTLFALLEEERLSPIYATDSIFDNCFEVSCVLPITRKSKAKGTLFGNIIPASNDSLRLEWSYFSENQEPEEFSISIPSRSPFSSILEGSLLQDALQTLLKRNKKKIQTQDTVFVKPAFNYVYVESEPDGAILTKAKGNAICKTPCTYATTDTGFVELYAYWDVDEHLWAEQVRTKILENDTTKILMKLQRIQPKIQIITHPEGAEIYPNDTITSFTARLGNTPKILNKNSLGPNTLFLTKEGFRDTTIQFYIMPTEKNKVEVTLTPLTIPNEIQAQQEQFKERLHQKIGITLIGTSVVPAVIGGIFAYLSAKDYDKAKEIRDELKEPHIAEGTNYEKQKKKNKDYADRSDERAYVSITSFAIAVGLLAAGITISF